MSDSLVDLLLVRLGREEEKRKVLKLLVTSLDLSVSDAEDAVNNSPSVIREAVPMGEARAIQKDLHPYIDLLPRFDDYEEEETGDDPEEIEAYEFEETETPVTETDSGEAEDSSDLESSVLITSVRDEVRSTRRCHICGRTPTNGEKLAPCRTCSELTCRDCFDRIAHVCSKCSASGKSIEHANEGVEAESEEGLVFDPDENTETGDTGPGSGKLKRIAAGVFILAVLAGVFYFVDPLNLFEKGSENHPSAAFAAADTAVSHSPDSLGSALVSNGSHPDTTEVAELVSTQDDPLKLASLSLNEEYAAIENPPPVVFRTYAPSSVNAVVLRDESDLIRDHLSTIAAWIPVALDDAVLLQYHDSTQVLVLALTHPEDTEVRLELIRRVSDWLTPSGIDQMVLLYRENRYQNTVIMSLVSMNFPLVQGILSPVQFQDYLSYREDCWESISGPVSEWLTDTQ